MQKLTRSQLSSFKRGLLAKQGGCCPICKKPIDLSVPREGVVDHDHETGEIRGVLHRSCNSAEGKVVKAAGSWGAKSLKYENVIPWLENLLEYLKSEGTGLIYPTHKTEEEKRLARNAKARKRRAQAKASRQVRSMKGRT